MAFYSPHPFAQIRSDNFGFIIASGVLSVEVPSFNLDECFSFAICLSNCEECWSVRRCQQREVGLRVHAENVQSVFHSCPFSCLPAACAAPMPAASACQVR